MMRGKRLLLALLAGLLLAGLVEGSIFKLPVPPPQHRYGDLLIDRVSTRSGQKPVFFSHWTHRTRYTCRVCHFELGFDFKVNRTEITEQANREGMYCGACHDGVVAFGPTDENCARCHTGKAEIDKQSFLKLQRTLPPTGFGNGINWTRALQKGLIAPKYSIYRPEEKPLDFSKRLELTANWSMVTPAIFDHATHVPWLDCANCHPDIFNIKKKTTRHFEMRYILEGKFCGVCHLDVAFPLDECELCHPGIKQR
ncbi:hypothetical protein C2E25_01105 [Geothermobacter hydrogeniphilus]|uniref:Cytochrome c7-like domain-containing protein n=1 Tax=Geothermobacter hydrogeniphilus TaxID=1969733 RepID=A0A2K2HE42_9BACT|nr:c(7)-type cytochrome triheme domain-containing protein [Geothermobacter hydrogeniphilus]PNU21491.1 hypothetical protein C2E25_01105 [Geothermobacter hydrogeniphilus]